MNEAISVDPPIPSNEETAMPTKTEPRPTTRATTRAWTQAEEPFEVPQAALARPLVSEHHEAEPAEADEHARLEDAVTSTIWT